METSFWTKVLDVIAPRACAICGKRLSPEESVLCVCCHLHMPLTDLAATPLDNPMARLFWGLLPIERAAAWFYYYPKADTSALIYDLKYHHQPELGRYMGQIAARRFAEFDFFEGIDAIVPVPITRRRQWERGYNQSMEVARGVSDVTDLPIYNKVVRRVNFAGSQTKKNPWERLENVEQSFQLVDGKSIEGLHLLVIDDIVTTGATIIACGEKLATACSKISVMSLGLTRN